MFNLFSRKKESEVKINELDLSNLLIVVKSLPEKYRFLTKQLTKELLIMRRPNLSLGQGWNSFDVDEFHLNRLEQSEHSKSIILSGIDVLCESGKCFNIDIFIIPGGILGAYKLEPNIDLRDEVFVSSNAEKIKVSVLSNKKIDSFIEKINSKLDRTILSWLELNDVFVINEFGKELFVLKSNNNGDFICCNFSLDVFVLQHDPFSIKDTKINLGKGSDKNDIVSLLKNFQ